MKAMSDKQLNEALALACGWLHDGDSWYSPILNRIEAFSGPPNYTSDLNAVAQAQAILLTPDWQGWEVYQHALARRWPHFPEEPPARVKAEALLEAVENHEHSRKSTRPRHTH